MPGSSSRPRLQRVSGHSAQHNRHALPFSSYPPSLAGCARDHRIYRDRQSRGGRAAGKNCCLSYTGRMKLYLDNSFLNRFFDDPALGANKLEREILLRVLDQAHNGDIQLVNSAVIAFENARNPFPERKQFVEQVMKTTSIFQIYTESAHERAEQLVSERKFSLYDARHLAV